MGQLMLINPRKRRTARKAKTTPRRKRRTTVTAKTNPVTPIRRKRRSVARSVARRVSRRYRRNPIGFAGITASIVDAGIGAVGAIGVDTVYNYLPLPADWKSGYKGAAGKVALALVVGTVGQKVLGKSAGKAAAGSLTVIAYDLIKSLMPPVVPAVAGMGYVGSGLNAGALPNMGEYVAGPTFGFDTSNAGMGEYVQTQYG